MRSNTHLGINTNLCGCPVQIEPGVAKVELQTSDVMSADDAGLVHGGFVFGAADYAAMLAVNDPYVVLGAAECRFLAPVRVGERVALSASVIEAKGKKHLVNVEGTVDDRTVFTATFTTFVLEKHVLSDT
ncbi:MAG: hotdog domain-containing protein [bacterium]